MAKQTQQTAKTEPRTAHGPKQQHVPEAPKDLGPLDTTIPARAPNRDKPEPVKKGDPFEAIDKAKQKKTDLRFFAVKYIRGPLAKDDPDRQGYVIIEATDAPDAKRQWFNMKNLQERSHSFDLRAAEIDASHPAAKDAKSFPHPVNPDAGGLSLEQMMTADFSEMQQRIASGADKAEKAEQAVSY